MKKIVEKIMGKAICCVTLSIVCVGLFVGWLACLCLDEPDIEYEG